MQLGSCGPPLGTEEGWLALTHGVSPMRTCGAMLHGRTLVLPYGCSDTFTRTAVADVDGMLTP